MFRVAIVLLIFIFQAWFSSAQELPPRDLLASQHEALDQISAQVPEASEEKLLELRETVRAIRVETDERITPLDIRRAELEADIARIDTAEGDPPPGIRELRNALQDEFDEIDAVVGQLQQNLVEANRLLVDIANARRTAFYARILERDKMPFSGEVLNPAWGSLQNNVETLKAGYNSWDSSFESTADRQWAWISILLSAIAAIILLWLFPRWAERNLLARYNEYEATPQRRTTLAALRFLIRVVPAVLAGTIVYQVLVANGIVTEETSKLVGSILLALGTIILVEDIASIVFAPKAPQWRLIPLASKRAVAVRLTILATVVVFSANAVLIRLSEWLGSSRELVEFGSASLSIIGAGLFFALSRKSLWQQIEERKFNVDKETQGFWRVLRILTATLAVLSVAGILVGYVAFGRFVLTRMYFLAFLFVAAWFARALFVDLANWIGAQTNTEADAAQLATQPPGKEDKRLLVFWLQLLVDITLVATLFPAVLLIFGAKWTDIRIWVADAVSGIEIGGFTFSFASVFSAIVALVIILFVTRIIQRATDARIFAPAGMDSGLRNTFSTLIGYVGLTMGSVVALGTLGFSFANFAIVAGALSLGIGFGLQSIVNNFVSGLILLFERPIKVGDWIVTSAGEGLVKRISVRSTEIETFDWASVIIPNSELITQPVTNWTHKNRYTRMIIPIGVSYDSDPETVSEILMEVAKENRRTLTFPKPIIYFAGFGDSALDFEVRIFINNVDDRIPVQNELRIAIFAALKDAGISIPFPQRDVHMRVNAADTGDQADQESPVPAAESQPDEPKTED